MTTTIDLTGEAMTEVVRDELATALSELTDAVRTYHLPPLFGAIERAAVDAVSSAPVVLPRGSHVEFLETGERGVHVVMLRTVSDDWHRKTEVLTERGAWLCLHDEGRPDEPATFRLVLRATR